MRVGVVREHQALAARALRKRRAERSGTADRMPPVLSAFRAEVKMSAATRSRSRLDVGLRKTPGTARREIIEAPTFVVPLSVAHVAVMTVELSDQQVGPAAAYRTICSADERQIAGDLIVGGNLAGDCRRSGVLPAMTGSAPMRMLGVSPGIRRHRVRCRHAADLHAQPRRRVRAAAPVETPPARRPVGRA